MANIVKAAEFDPAKFIGPGWSIKKGNTMVSSLSLVEVDPSKIILKSYIKPGEFYIKYEERKERCRPLDIHLGLNFFLALWRHRRKLPESWQQKTKIKKGIFVDTTIYFTGQTLLDPFGREAVMGLCYRFGSWDFDWDWLHHPWVKADVSAVVKGKY